MKKEKGWGREEGKRERDLPFCWQAIFFSLNNTGEPSKKTIATNEIVQ